MENLQQGIFLKKTNEYLILNKKDFDVINKCYSELMEEYGRLLMDDQKDEKTLWFINDYDFISDILLNSYRNDNIAKKLLNDNGSYMLYPLEELTTDLTLNEMDEMIGLLISGKLKNMLY